MKGSLLQKAKNPPEAGFFNLVPEPGQRCATPVNGALAPARRASLINEASHRTEFDGGIAAAESKKPARGGFL